MRRLPPPTRTDTSALRSAIQQLSIRQLPLQRESMAVSLMAGAVLLVLAPAGQALTLGDINVRSTLGQRLAATIPVQLAQGEALATACVVPGQPASDLRQVPGASVSTPQATLEGRYELQISSTAALYEPMYALDLKVECPGAPALIRQYVLMLDLPAAMASVESSPATAAATAATATDPALPTATSERSVAPRAAVPRRARTATNRPRTPIEAGTRYGVVAGDTLSSIAARVRGREGSLWAMADAIQAANPNAFIRNDPDRIRLGSEILIPGRGSPEMAQPETATQSAPLTPPLSALEPVAVAPPVVATEVPAPVDLPAAPVAARSLPVAPAEAKAKPTRPAAVKRTVPEPVAAAEDSANPIASAGAGILFGLCISALLWFRGRLPERKREPATHRTEARDTPSPPPATAPLAVAPLVTRTTEPAFSVSYTPPADDLLTAEFAADSESPTVIAPPPSRTAAPAASEDITSELEDLFDNTDTTIQKRLNAAKTIAARTLDANSFAVPQRESTVDFLIGDSTGEEATLRSQTVEQPRPDTDRLSQTGSVDLHALASSATKDQQQAQTLLEALTLLERDYEQELTASQIVDMSAMRAALGNNPAEPTQVHQPQPRKKFR